MGAVRKAVVLLQWRAGLHYCPLGDCEAQGFEVHRAQLRVRPGSRIELEAASRIATQVARDHVVVTIDLRVFGGSALTSDIEVPKHDARRDGDRGARHLCSRAQHDLSVVRSGLG